MGGSGKEFQDLCNSIIHVRDVILRPLQCLDGGVPSEISAVVNELRS